AGVIQVRGRIDQAQERFVVAGDRGRVGHLVHTGSGVVVVVGLPLLGFRPAGLLALVDLEHHLAEGVGVNDVLAGNRVGRVGRVVVGKALDGFDVPVVIARILRQVRVCRIGEAEGALAGGAGGAASALDDGLGDRVGHGKPLIAQAVVLEVVIG